MSVSLSTHFNLSLIRIIFILLFDFNRPEWLIIITELTTLNIEIPNQKEVYFIKKHLKYKILKSRLSLAVKAYKNQSLTDD